MALTPWVAAADLAACGGTADQRTQAAAAVTEILHVLSGRQFGARRLVERPACRWDCTLSSTHRPDRVRLEGSPVLNVVSVAVDGGVVNAGAYTIANKRWLLRIDGSVWPCPADAATSTFIVTYDWGKPVPASGEVAAQELACELVKALANDSSCKLPKRVTSMVREGIALTVIDPQVFLDKGRTGLYWCDLFISTYNPTGRRRRASVHSPEFPNGVHRA